jgi:hypothetical protein
MTTLKTYSDKELTSMMILTSELIFLMKMTKMRMKRRRGRYVQIAPVKTYHLTTKIFKVLSPESQT